MLQYESYTKQLTHIKVDTGKTKGSSWDEIESGNVNIEDEAAQLVSNNRSRNVWEKAHPCCSGYAAYDSVGGSLATPPYHPVYNSHTPNHSSNADASINAT